jgi:CPA1 family monovalent cation:H+ antiporter
LFIKEAAGGLVFGLAIGVVAYQLLKRTDNYQVEIMTTLALAMGGYALAEALHVSAPIAVVVAGLLTGNQGRSFAMSDVTRERLDSFWELIDEILNAVLFVLIGLEVLVMPITGGYLVAALAIIPITLLARFISVWGVLAALRRRRDFSPGAELILTWGGLRGAISVAMALSSP